MTSAPISHPNIIVLGGGYAGFAAATRLSKIARASITLVDAKPEFVERIRLHQVATGQPLQLLPYREFLQPRGVKFIQARAMALDPDRSSLTIRDQCGVSASLQYDYLVYALGSTLDLDAVDGVGEYAHTLESFDASKKIHSMLVRLPKSSRVLVVGGGLTGIETAAEIAESFPQLRVALAIDQPFKAQRLPGGYSIQAIQYLQRAFDQLGIAVREACRVVRLHEGRAETSRGEAIPFDICIWTTGFAPPPLPSDSGIQVNGHGQIITDPSLRSVSHPNIIAIGDAAQARTREGGPCRMSCATALAMATAGSRTLAALIAGAPPPEFRFVYLFRNICLGRKDGLIQFVDRSDIPRNVVWTGSLAARWKEYISRGTLSTIGFYPPEKMPAIPPLRMLAQLLRAPGQYA